MIVPYVAPSGTMQVGGWVDCFDVLYMLCYGIGYPAPVAQRKEQRFPKPLVVGSTPTGGIRSVYTLVEISSPEVGI